jgi:hypothetical protein
MDDRASQLRGEPLNVDPPVRDNARWERNAASLDAQAFGLQFPTKPRPKLVDFDVTGVKDHDGPLMLLEVRITDCASGASTA